MIVPCLREELAVQLELGMVAVEEDQRINNGLRKHMDPSRSQVISVKLISFHFTLTGVISFKNQLYIVFFQGCILFIALGVYKLSFVQTVT